MFAKPSSSQKRHDIYTVTATGANPPKTGRAVTAGRETQSDWRNWRSDQQQRLSLIDVIEPLCVPLPLRGPTLLERKIGRSPRSTLCVGLYGRLKKSEFAENGLFQFTIRCLPLARGPMWGHS
ncbi:hypothetical protein [Rhizobium leguminosarum]|uniref:hypothetical protein n=1 Tax=Rhizobium leguminosarum TaxID=384 RepID=UPI001C970B38|nr:hypothetical protein [Rhizobium leguminosarum]MBY5441882.1 hypothetical protein [Rhizobium leguminosarum]